MKNVLTLAALVLSVPALAQDKMSLRQVLDEVPGTKTYKVQAAGFRPITTADGGTMLEAACFRIVTVTRKDGGTGTIVLDPADCKLSRANETAVLKAMSDSSVP